MTEENRWRMSNSPAHLLYTAKQRKFLKPRKALLFACGCYRLVWDKIQLATLREALEKTEERADRKLSQQELAKYRHPKGWPPQHQVEQYLYLSISSLITPKMIPIHVAWLVRTAVDPTNQERADKWEDCKPQADLVRDILGNPFRPVVFAAEWRTSTAVAIAQGMYESRDFSAMPILADALQDAGCDNDNVLNHCRDPQQVHVRGCWVVDGVLGKS